MAAVVAARTVAWLLLLRATRAPGPTPFRLAMLATVASFVTDGLAGMLALYLSPLT
jgi:hypothetical protein